MKKILVLVCSVIILFSTSVYSNIQLTATNLGNNQIAIGYNVTSGSNVPIGFGLNMILSDGATFERVVSTSSLFPLFPGSIAFDMHGNVTNWGIPVSPIYNPGTLGAIGSSGITLEMSANISIIPAVNNDIRDLNRDGLINYNDYSIFANNWLIDGFRIQGDLNDDYFVNMVDMAFLADSQGISSNLSQLIVLEIDLNGATNPMLRITPEATYRGGIVADDGTIFSVDQFQFIVPEPGTLILICVVGMILRKRN
jgi:hypothetical protein